MANDEFEELKSKVTDLNQRMCRVEKQADSIGEQIGNISANLSTIANQSVKERRFFVRHLTYVGAATTLLITVALIIFHLVN